MEKRINKKFDVYFSEFKDKIRENAVELGISKDNKMIQLIQFICDYEKLSLTKEDFMKRKRVKNAVHLSDRCCAKRANGEQCTRRKKENNEYCGTHLKGTPHGICENDEEVKVPGKKIEVWAQDIKGIIYYIDKFNNVYQMEDIISNKSNPKVIAKYVKFGDDYSIPEFSI
jgi:hypothetical protein